MIVKWFQDLLRAEEELGSMFVKIELRCPQCKWATLVSILRGECPGLTCICGYKFVEYKG